MVVIDEKKCIGCGLCAADCIALNIEVEEKARIKKECMQCGHCVAVCPQGAVSIPEYDMADVEEYDADSFTLQPEQVLHSIKFRRSIRDYKPKQVEESVLRQLVQAGRYTATAKNSQSNGFVFVQKELTTLKDKVWQFIDDISKKDIWQIDKALLPYILFNQRRKKDATDDYLFRNAPAVLYIVSDSLLDAGLAAQNMETMAVSLGLGVLYNGYLARISDANEELKQWLGIGDRTICTCMLLGYPARHYVRTAPRKAPDVIWK